MREYRPDSGGYGNIVSTAVFGLKLLFRALIFGPAESSSGSDGVLYARKCFIYLLYLVIVTGSASQLVEFENVLLTDWLTGDDDLELGQSPQSLQLK